MKIINSLVIDLLIKMDWFSFEDYVKVFRKFLGGKIKFEYWMLDVELEIPLFH